MRGGLDPRQGGPVDAALLCGMESASPLTPRVVDLDLRPHLAMGEHPLPLILTTAESLPRGSTLRLIVPFEPKPLYHVLGARGFDHEATQRADGLWEIVFRSPAPGGSERVLDVRDLEPPEPLQRALEALPALGRHETLLVRTRFRPAHLIDQLGARGFEHEAVFLGDAGWETAVWRRS